MIKFSSIFIILFSFYSWCYGQKLLFHKNRHREALYKVGDVISFRVKNSDSKISGQIRSFEDSLIVFQNFKVNPNKITHLYVDSKTKNWYILRYKYEKIFLISGIGYLLLDVLNTGELSKETLVISGSLVAAGLLAKWLISDRIRIKGRRKLVIIH
jgi:hypothetical protein